MKSATPPNRFLQFCWLLLAAIALTPFGRVIAQDHERERDSWQRPQQVMDELGVKAGSAVADVGCGSGYFTFLLAARVGQSGKVYAVDIKDDRLEDIRRRAKKEGLTQIETILGAEDDPRLPPDSVEAALLVDAYHEMRHYDAMLTGINRALKPGGLLALIDGEAKPGQPRDDYYTHHRMPEEIERQDAQRNGFRFLRQPQGFKRTDDGKQYYFLIFEKPKGE